MFQNWLEEAIFLPFPGGQRTSAEGRVEFFPLLSKGRTQEQQNGKLMKIAGIKNFEEQMLEGRTSYNNENYNSALLPAAGGVPFARPFELINNLGIVQDRTIKRSRQQSAKRYHT